MDISKYLKSFRTAKIYVRSKATAQSNSMGAIVEVESEERELSCDLQPGSGSLYVAEYGERARNMLFAFVDADTGVKQGDLVRIYATTKPDYRVVATPAHTSYARLDLERV